MHRAITNTLGLQKHPHYLGHDVGVFFSFLCLLRSFSTMTRHPESTTTTATNMAIAIPTETPTLALKGVDGGSVTCVDGDGLGIITDSDDAIHVGSFTNSPVSFTIVQAA